MNMDILDDIDGLSTGMMKLQLQVEELFQAVLGAPLMLQYMAVSWIEDKLHEWKIQQKEDTSARNEHNHHDDKNAPKTTETIGGQDVEHLETRTTRNKSCPSEPIEIKKEFPSPANKTSAGRLGVEHMETSTENISPLESTEIKEDRSLSGSPEKQRHDRSDPAVSTSLESGAVPGDTEDLVYERDGSESNRPKSENDECVRKFSRVKHDDDVFGSSAAKGKKKDSRCNHGNQSITASVEGSGSKRKRAKSAKQNQSERGKSGNITETATKAAHMLKQVLSKMAVHGSGKAIAEEFVSLSDKPLLQEKTSEKTVPTKARKKTSPRKSQSSKPSPKRKQSKTPRKPRKNLNNGAKDSVGNDATCSDDSPNVPLDLSLGEKPKSPKRKRSSGKRPPKSPTKPKSLISQMSEEELLKARECPICGKVLSTVNALRAHLTVHSDNRPYLCQHCGMAFKTAVSLRNHFIAVHGGEKYKRFVCKFCDYRGVTRQGVEMHERHRHTGEKPFLCDSCGFASFSNHRLKLHKLTAHTQPTIQCDECGLYVHSMERLQGHKKYVHVEKKFQCTVCNSMLKSSGSLKIHMRSHTGEKPYPCPSCDKAFTSSNRLAAHKKVHNKSLQLKCPECDKHFLDRAKLKIHSSVHTGQKDMKCPYCEYCTYTRFNLKKHCKSKHQVDYPPILQTCIKDREIVQATDIVPTIEITIQPIIT